MLRGFVRVQNVSLADLVQYRMISGSAANFLAAHQRTDVHLEQMSTAIKEMEATESEATQQFAEADLRFHQAIADASGNALLNVVGQVINDVDGFISWPAPSTVPPTALAPARRSWRYTTTCSMRSESETATSVLPGPKLTVRGL